MDDISTNSHLLSSMVIALGLTYVALVKLKGAYGNNRYIFFENSP